MTGSSIRGAAARPRLARSVLLLAATCALHGVGAAAPAATVIFASGDVRVQTAQGTSRSVANGASIESGETIATGKGRVQLRMVDGAMMALGEGTQLRLDDYHAAGPAGDDERGYMSLVKGALRTVSGSIGKARPDNYKLETQAGTIGIRGTEYTAAVDDGLRVGVIGGRVAVCNDGGCVEVPRGSSAFTAARSARPVVSPRLSLLVPPANGGESATVTATAAGAASPVAAMAAAPLPATAPTAGEQTARALAIALSTPVAPAPVGGVTDDALPALGSSNGSAATVPTPAAGITATAPAAAAPAAPAPAPAPAPTPVAAPAPAAPAPVPAPTPSPTAAPAPSPAPAPAPAVVAPPAAAPAVAAPPPAPTPSTPGAAVALASSVNTVGLVWTTEKGEPGSGVVQGTAVYDERFGLQRLTGGGSKDDDKKVIEKGTALDPRSDGVVAWGRWVDGQSKVNDASGRGKGNIAALHYFAFAEMPTLPTIGSFASFASTAPTVTSAGKLVATGTVNTATGTVNAALTAIGGLASYTLVVPVPTQTFTLTGTALQVAANTFSGNNSLITSTGTGCSGGCVGTLVNGASVIGMVGGSTGNRIGVTYGFDSRVGNVTGVIVFKR